MATTNDQVSQEYLYIKVFLYKYTPPFAPVLTQTAGGLSSTVSSALSTFKPFEIPLDDTNYFTKYDISQFVAGYSFDQNIEETAYSWTVELQDLALSYSTINKKLKVAPPAGSTLTNGLSFATSADTQGLVTYETNANTFYHNTDFNGPIIQAKTNRGRTPGPMTTQNTNITDVLSTVPGLRLSDLIQEYDFISVFLYKNSTPLTDIYGVFTVDDSIDNNPLQIFNYKVTSDVTPPFQNYQNPLDPYIKYESVLLTKMPNGNTLFSNEFNGFVIKKSVTSSINQVDKLVLSGNGWSRLFGSTRRAIKPSLFQNSLYQAGQVLGLSDVSAAQTVYAGKTIAEITKDLFDLVYRIDFNPITNAEIEAAAIPVNPNNSTNLATSTLNQDGFFTSPLGGTPAPFVGPQPQPLLLGTSFYNITSLIVANSYPANLFNMPQYLLSTVMKLRPFSYIEPINLPVSADFLAAARASAAQYAVSGAQPGQVQTTDQVALSTNYASIQIPPETFQQAMQNFSPSEQVLNYGSSSPVFVDPQVQNLKAYFTFLSQVFQPFSPQLQTPFEIFDEIRRVSFVEIYEQPNGQFIIRAPQYNNMAATLPNRSDIGMIRSNNLNIISTNYATTVENLVTKMFTGYSPNITPIDTLQQFGYCDGKLLIQDGLLETTTSANPNAVTASLANSNTNNSRTTGIFGWIEYLMELSNAKLKTGTLVCDLDNTIQVGQTFIDETKYKFGYIVSVSKRISVTGTATMSLSLSYVRDAVPEYNTANEIININTDLLPVLTDIENSFAGS